MTNQTNPAALTWFTSTRSSANGHASCAPGCHTAAGLKDSKHPRSPVLSFSSAQWQAFTKDIRRDDLN